MYSFVKCLPGHESPNLGPSTFCNEEANNGVSHCTPGFTDEEYHGGLNGINLQRGTAKALLLLTAREHLSNTSLSLSLDALPGQHRAGRFAERKPWHWQPPPSARRRWQSRVCCIVTVSYPARSVRMRVAEGVGVNVGMTLTRLYARVSVTVYPLMHSN